MTDQETAAEAYRRKLAWRRTPEENMRFFVQLQRQAFDVLKASPETMDHFIRRNHRKRRQSEVLRLLHKTLPASQRSKDRLDLENLPAGET
ncbi:hypothetical protein Mal15_69640 [Stieleria maiorica]|uniref:Uncharacterized protein n=1 Tax=Stieleria maiorica TaxID=2795974 RepID=A0A5B9MNE1_9BACT|nr:hypothetical protein [Stieleria maiorica]QEG02843.1 hypothetical protein Mal15_69640 [Stieleria maiorica]